MELFPVFYEAAVGSQVGRQLLDLSLLHTSAKEIILAANEELSGLASHLDDEESPVHIQRLGILLECYTRSTHSILVTVCAILTFCVGERYQD